MARLRPATRIPRLRSRPQRPAGTPTAGEPVQWDGDTALANWRRHNDSRDLRESRTVQGDHLGRR
jgi:hypothetical protein